MQPLKTGILSRGYAEILCADGAMALLRLHAGADDDEIGEEQLCYAVARHDEVVYVSAESSRAAERFNRLIGSRMSDTSAGAGREDFLATTPTRLPLIRGAAFDRLASQVTELSRGGRTEH